MSLDSPLNGKKNALIYLAIVGVSLYWTFTYTGPYRYLAELQLKWFGSYVPKLTLAVIVLGLVGVAALIQYVLKGAERSVPAPATPVVSPTASVPNQATILGTDPSVMRFARYFAPLVAFGIGAYFYYNGTHTGGLQQLSAQDFLSGKLQANIVYADVRGRLSERYLSKDNYVYIPMTEDGNFAGPLHLLVGMNKSEMEALREKADGTFTLRGVADKGLAGDVKYAFEKEGLTVGEPCWVLHFGREPSGDRIAGLVAMGIGILFFAILYGREKYQTKKALAPRPLQMSA